MYSLSAFLYYINVCLFLKWDKELRKYYSRKILYISLLPLFNFMIYWFRFAGIINSIKGASSWKTKGFNEEVDICKDIISKDFIKVKAVIDKIKSRIYKNGENEEEKK